MIFIELHGDFETEDEVLQAVQSVMDRLEFDPETGEISGFFEDDEEEIVVEVPDHIIAWAKNSPMSDDIVTQADNAWRRQFGME